VIPIGVLTLVTVFCGHFEKNPFSLTTSKSIFGDAAFFLSRKLIGGEPGGIACAKVTACHLRAL